MPRGRLWMARRVAAGECSRQKINALFSCKSVTTTLHCVCSTTSFPVRYTSQAVGRNSPCAPHTVAEMPPPSWGNRKTVCGRIDTLGTPRGVEIGRAGRGPLLTRLKLRLETDGKTQSISKTCRGGNPTTADYGASLRNACGATERFPKAPRKNCMFRTPNQTGPMLVTQVPSLSRRGTCAAKPTTHQTGFAPCPLR